MTTRTRAAALAFGIDVAATLVFVLTGRGSHNEDASLIGFLTTWWPFLAALVLGWLLTSAWRHPLGVLWPGVGIWLTTILGGMLLRAASGQGTALPFIIVAAATLLVALVGWRVIAFAVRRARRR